MAERQTSLANKLPRGWNGQIAADPDGTHYLLVANFTDQPGEAHYNLFVTQGSFHNRAALGPVLLK